jgi:imidazole glycerol phosphate synthase subunit HisF
MDQTNIADGVSRWTGFGIKFSKELAKAVELLETLRYAEVGRLPVFDIEAVTPENAEDKIHEFAKQLALSEVPGGGLSVLDKAKKQAVEGAARRVVNLARHEVPSVIEQLTPDFDKHVEAYTAAVVKLPDDITAETLVAAGADAVSAYSDALQEVQYLNRIDNWVVQTGYVAGIIPKNMEVVIRILRPTSISQLAKLDAARHKQANQTLLALDTVFFTAAREGFRSGSTP